ncbi:hypothetical protein JCM3766R1_004987 [Sporobolomyces carnicolor]
MKTTALLVTFATLVSAGVASIVPVQRPLFDMTPATSRPALTDLLTRSRNSRLFYDYVRDSRLVSTRLGDVSEASTVLAPIDSAIVSLARKPHQGPPGPITAYSLGSREDEHARATYLERWTKRHVVPELVELNKPGPYVTLGGATVTLVKSEGDNGRTTYRVMPGDVEVLEIETASNGIILYLKETLNLDSVD